MIIPIMSGPKPSLSDFEYGPALFAKVEIEQKFPDSGVDSPTKVSATAA